MRDLNPFEQNIIRRIVTQHHRDIVTLLDPYMNNKDIVLNYDERTATIHFDQAIYFPNNNVGANNLIDEALTIADTIISIVGLLNYLKENNYIKLIQSSARPNPPRFGRLVRGHQSITYQIYDREITDLLLENAFKTIIVEQVLVNYFNDNFLTKEDIRHRANITWAKRAFVGAIVIGILDLSIGSLDTYFDGASYYDDTKIDTTQVDKVIEAIKGNEDRSNDNSINLNIINDLKQNTIKVLNLKSDKKPSH